VIDEKLKTGFLYKIAESLSTVKKNQYSIYLVAFGWNAFYSRAMLPTFLSRLDIFIHFVMTWLWACVQNPLKWFKI